MMDAHQLIDAQFDRAVQIVQSLPKTGPIQTGYEEKLAMYSLYKQATVGNVKGPRPAMWDMLGRAKWDAWAKHKDLDPYEAKWLYVDELLRVLNKYSDKTMARDLVRELESYGGDPSNIIASGSLPRSHRSHESDSSSSSVSASPSPAQRRLSGSVQQRQQQKQAIEPSDDSDSEHEEERDDRLGEGLQHRLSQSVAHSQAHSVAGRPQSSLSTHRYRTPMGGSTVISPPPPVPQVPLGMTTQPLLQHQQGYTLTQPGLQPQAAPGVYIQPQSVPLAYTGVPNTQPLPAYETPSAFPGPSPPVSSPGLHHTVSGASASAASSYAHIGLGSSSAYTYNVPGLAQRMSQGMESGILGSGSTGLAGRSPLERAVENVQTHLSALQERMELLEAQTGTGSTSFGAHSRGSLGGSGIPGHASPFGSFHGNGGASLWTWITEFDAEYFDWDHMGLWSVVLAPLARTTKFLARIVAFLLARRQQQPSGRGGGERMSPGLVVLRRLILDASFVLCVLLVGRKIWRKSGVRRREVVGALKAVWAAIVGNGAASAGRVLVDKAV